MTPYGVRSSIYKKPFTLYRSPLVPSTMPTGSLSPPLAPSIPSASTPANMDLDLCEHPCKHHPSKDPFERNQAPHAKSLNKFIRDTVKALKVLYPRGRGRYNTYDLAHILFLRWKDDDLNTQSEIDDLREVLSQLHLTTNDEKLFTLDQYTIPSDDFEDELEGCLVQKKLDFTKKATQLLVIYYGGHAEMDAKQHCIWFPSIDTPEGLFEMPRLNWTKMQQMFQDREGDVVFILDSCYASSAVRGSQSAWKGFKELLAAGGKTQMTEGVNDNSFTRALIRELQFLQKNKQSTTLSALQLALTSAQTAHGLKNTPVRLGLSDRANKFDSWSLSFAEPSSDGQVPPPDATNNDTRVLMSIRLHNPAVPMEIYDWDRWLKRQAPADIADIDIAWTDLWLDYVRLEGVFHHRSTLLLLSLPANLWESLSRDPTYNFIDVVKSENLMSRGNKSVDLRLDLEAVTGIPEDVSTSFNVPEDLRSMDETAVSSPSESYYPNLEEGKQPLRISDDPDALERDTPPQIGGRRFNLIPVPPGSRPMEKYASAQLGENSFYLVPLSTEDKYDGKLRSRVLEYDDRQLSTVPKLVYEALPKKNKTFRLVRLLAAPLEDRQLNCELFEVEFNDNEVISPSNARLVGDLGPVEYEAISWCWGPVADHYDVFIRQNGRLYKKPVQRALASALKSLRRIHNDRVLWIDAICINLYDPKERNSQVELIPGIFGNATNVCVWLGAEDESSALAMPFMNRIQVQNLETIFTGYQYTKEWQSVFTFLQRPWFSRRWVVQEISIARQAVMYCGLDSMSWGQFSVAVGLIIQAGSTMNRIPALMHTGAIFNHLPLLFEHASELAASRLVQTTGALFHSNQSRNPFQRQPLLSLEYLVSTLYMFQNTEPRDTVYSILSIARDATPVAKSFLEENRVFSHLVKSFFRRKPYPVDYSQPYADACRDFVSFCIERSSELNPSQALDILFRPWASAPPPPSKSRKFTREERSYASLSHPDDDYWEKVLRYLREEMDVPLPSWVCSVSRVPFELYPHPQSLLRKLGRKNADPLVGMPADGRNNYKASWRGPDLEAIKFRNRSSLAHYSLYVEGFILDEVAEVADSSQGGLIPSAWLTLAGWHDVERTDPPDEFWRTIVADRGTHSRNPPFYYSSACKEVAMLGGLASGAINTESLINSSRNAIVVEFCRRVQSVIWNRCLVRTRRGLLGLSSNTEKGDLLCILHGCTVPVILRRFSKDDKMLEEESLVDRVQALKISIRKCEEACIRKRHVNNYRKHQTEWEKDHIRAATREFNKGRGQLRQRKSDDIREMTIREENPDHRYFFALIGESYIHGLMDGEALDEKKLRSIPDQVFELR